VNVYRAEYIWIDGTTPTQKLRSKTKIVPKGEEPPIWAFDGSSTQQATGDRSDCVLQPVFTVPDPIRGGEGLRACVIPRFRATVSRRRAPSVHVTGIPP